MSSGGTSHMPSGGSSDFVQNPRSSDVLFGRGATVFGWDGNKEYRRLVNERKVEYSRTTSRSRKNEIAKEIMQEIRYKHNGRFLIKAAATGDDNFVGFWKLVCDSVVTEKVKQALRERSDCGVEDGSKPWSPAQNNEAHHQRKKRGGYRSKIESSIARSDDERKRQRVDPEPLSEEMLPPCEDVDPPLVFQDHPRVPRRTYNETATMLPRYHEQPQNSLGLDRQLDGLPASSALASRIQHQKQLVRQLEQELFEEHNSGLSRKMLELLLEREGLRLRNQRLDRMESLSSGDLQGEQYQRPDHASSQRQSTLLEVLTRPRGQGEVGGDLGITRASSTLESLLRREQELSESLLNQMNQEQRRRALRLFQDSNSNVSWTRGSLHQAGGDGHPRLR